MAPEHMPDLVRQHRLSSPRNDVACAVSDLTDTGIEHGPARRAVSERGIGVQHDRYPARLYAHVAARGRAPALGSYSRRICELGSRIEGHPARLGDDLRHWRGRPWRCIYGCVRGGRRACRQQRQGQPVHMVRERSSVRKHERSVKWTRPLRKSPCNSGRALV